MRKVVLTSEEEGDDCIPQEEPELQKKARGPAATSEGSVGTRGGDIEGSERWVHVYASDAWVSSAAT